MRTRHAGARLHDGRAREAADEGVRGGGREAPPPREEVPDDRAHERREDEVAVHDGRVHDVLADRLRDARLERERRDEVEERGPGDGDLGREDARSDDGRDRVRRVVEAVDEVEREGDEDDEDDEGHRRRLYEDFRTICSRTFATSSQRSVASSRTS